MAKKSMKCSVYQKRAELNPSLNMQMLALIPKGTHFSETGMRTDTEKKP